MLHIIITTIAISEFILIWIQTILMAIYKLAVHVHTVASPHSPFLLSHVCSSSSPCPFPHLLPPKIIDPDR